MENIKVKANSVEDKYFDIVRHSSNIGIGSLSYTYKCKLCDWQGHFPLTGILMGGQPSDYFSKRLEEGVNAHLQLHILDAQLELVECTQEIRREWRREEVSKQSEPEFTENHPKAEEIICRAQEEILKGSDPAIVVSRITEEFNLKRHFGGSTTLLYERVFDMWEKSRGIIQKPPSDAKLGIISDSPECQAMGDLARIDCGTCINPESCTMPEDFQKEKCRSDG